MVESKDVVINMQKILKEDQPLTKKPSKTVSIRIEQSLKLDKESRSLDIPEKELSSRKSLNLQSMELDDSSLLPKKKEPIKEKRQEEEESDEDQDIGEDEEEDESYLDDARHDTEIGGGKNFEELKTFIVEAEKDSKIHNKEVLRELNGYLKNLAKKAKQDQTSDCLSEVYKWRAECYIRMNQYIQATSDFQKSLDLKTTTNCSRSSKLHFSIRKIFSKYSNDL